MKCLFAPSALLLIGSFISVDASPSNTGLTTMDVLEKSPGISIDEDGNIKLNGKAGPLVLVDGNPTYLSPADLAALLTNLPSSQLDQIEIMSNPPAKYDAAGNAGVINIRTKKLKIKGLNGNLSLGGGMGIHPRSNDNFRPISQDHTFKAGIDADLTKKTSLGFSISGLVDPSHERDSDTTNIYDPHHTLDSLTVASGNIRKRFSNIGMNLNFRHVFDTAGAELDIDLDYLRYHSGDRVKNSNG